MIFVTVLMEFEVNLMLQSPTKSFFLDIITLLTSGGGESQKRRYLGRTGFITKSPSNPIMIFGLAAKYRILDTANSICGIGFQRALIPIILSVLDIVCADSLKCAKREGI